MPVYTFVCEECNKEIEIACSISEYDSVVENLKTEPCDNCNKTSLVRDFAADNIHGHVKTIKTLGQLAEHNRRKYGEELSSKMIESYKTKPEVPQVLPEGAKIVQPKGGPASSKERRSANRKKKK